MLLLCNDQYNYFLSCVPTGKNKGTISTKTLQFKQTLEPTILVGLRKDQNTVVIYLVILVVRKIDHNINNVLTQRTRTENFDS